MNPLERPRPTVSPPAVLHFVKMHGLGNDYVLIDGELGLPYNPRALAQAVSDRNRGIGSDGLIAILPPSAGEDFGMAIWNADGSDGGLCVNGLRCAVRWLRDRGKLRSPRGSARTGGGIVEFRCTETHDIEVFLGAPRLCPADIPVVAEGDRVIDEPFDLGGSTIVRATAVSVGNPHLVVRCGADRGLVVDDVERLGPRLEVHRRLPERANVHFVETVAAGHLRQRSWERGSGLTRACGSGAAATVVAWGVAGEPRTAYRVETDGGVLEVQWHDDGRVRVRGPAMPVFEGEWPLESAT